MGAQNVSRILKGSCHLSLCFRCPQSRCWCDGHAGWTGPALLGLKAHTLPLYPSCSSCSTCFFFVCLFISFICIYFLLNLFLGCEFLFLQFFSVISFSSVQPPLLVKNRLLFLVRIIQCGRECSCMGWSTRELCKSCVTSWGFCSPGCA